MYTTIEPWYYAPMQPITTATAIQARLFARFEGGGKLLCSVPGGMKDLAEKLVDPEGLQIGEPIQLRKIGKEWRQVFGVRADAIEFVGSLMCIGSRALERDRWALGEMLDRIGLSGLDTRPLSRLEMEYLQAHIGVGNWCRGIGLLED